MRRKLALLASWSLMIALLSCGTPPCTYTVQVGSPDTDVTYTDSDGTPYTAKTDANGNVAVPCGTEDTVEKIRISIVNSSV